MKTLILNLSFLCFIGTFSSCNNDVEQLDLANSFVDCQSANIEINLRERTHRSVFTDYLWRDWNDGLAVDSQNGGKRLIFSFPEGFVCGEVAALGGEMEEICSVKYAELERDGLSFVFDLGECLLGENIVFLRVGY